MKKPLHQPSKKPSTSPYEAMMKQANKHLRAGQGVLAIEIYNKVLSDNPMDMRAWMGVGMAMVLTQQWKHALDNFEFVLSQRPHYPEALYGMSSVKQAMGDHQGAREAIDAACSAAPDSWLIHRYKGYIYATTGASPEEILQIYCDWGQKFADPLTDKALPFAPLSTAQKNPRRKLRIGYVSGDLRLHSIAFFIEPIFQHHDPEQVDVHVYSTLNIKDTYTMRMQQHVPHWHDVFEMSEDELFKLIRKHRIDVLIDLSGHTAGDRLMVFARKAAPVQLTWLGYMYPLGMKAVPYRLSDYGNITPETRRHYNETPFYIQCGGMYHPPHNAPLCLVPPIVKNGYPTFISLNNSRKVTDEILQTWGKILKQLPTARMILMTDEREQAKALEHMLPRLHAFDLPEDRITISKRLKLDEFMRLAERADVQLDTYPISGGTTTFHALWMGLPVVALKGNDASSSSTESILNVFGYQDWLVEGTEAYVQKAIELGQNTTALQQQRQHCRAHMQAKPIMNYSERTREIERAYRLMWFNHLLGKTVFTDANHDLEQAIQTHFAETTS
jgi:protein O-GlcNAc transferase